MDGLISSPYAKAVAFGHAMAIATAAAGGITMQACQTQNDSSSQPSPVPLSDIAIPNGGVAVLFGPQYCCNLVTVAPDGAVSYEFGTTIRLLGRDPTHPHWEWQRAVGTIPTRTDIGSVAARNFITTTDQIPSTYLYPDPYWNRSVHATFARQTVYGTIRSGVAFFDDYHGQQDAVFSSLGLEPSTQTATMPPIPADAVGLIYGSTFFVVYRSGRITEQIGDFGAGQDGRAYARPSSGVYEVEPISRALAWRIVTFAPTVVVLPGCPGLDDPTFYRGLFIVTNDHITNGLYCHRFAPMREELMSVVEREYPRRN